MLRDAALDYTGVDLSASAIDVCATFGPDALGADAIALPCEDNTFDAAWSMSTLVHLPGDDLGLAFAELARVVRLGGLADIGVWGHTKDRDWTSNDGRYFRHR